MSMLARLVVSPLLVASALSGPLPPAFANLLGGELPPEVVEHIRDVLEPKVLALYPRRYTDDLREQSSTTVPPLPPGYGGQLPVQVARL